MNDLPAAPPCDQGISEEVARQVYERLGAIQGHDDCVLDDVSTDKSQMTVRWTSKGAALPPAELRPSACAPGGAVAGPTLAISLPEPTRAACPATAAAAVEAVRHESFGGLASPRGWRWLGIGLAILAAVALVIALERRRRRSGGPRTTPP